MSKIALSTFFKVLFFLIFFFKLDQKCKTYNNGECTFPFINEGIEYNKCTPDENNTLWCATQVDENGQVDGDNWDYCDEKTCLGG